MKNMKTIISKDNPLYKKCLQLNQKKYRDRYSEFIVEGGKLVDEARMKGRAKLVIIDEDQKCRYTPDDRDTVFMKGSLFSKIAQTENSMGIAAVVEKNCSEGFPADSDGNVVVLDRLQDPGNIGTIIRTAEAAGYAGVMTLKGTGDVYSPKTVRAAAGSLLRMPIMQVDTPEEAVAYLHKAGKTIVTTSLEADMYYYMTDLTENVALVIGNEGNGVSEHMQQSSDINIKIPMEGETESLNAAVAAGILMYQSMEKGRKRCMKR